MNGLTKGLFIKIVYKATVIVHCVGLQCVNRGIKMQGAALKEASVRVSATLVSRSGFTPSCIRDSTVSEPVTETCHRRTFSPQPAALQTLSVDCYTFGILPQPGTSRQPCNWLDGCHSNCGMSDSERFISG